MSSMKRGGRGRTIVAIVVSMILVTGAGISLWPRPGTEVWADAAGPHAAHLKVIVSGSDSALAVSPGTVVTGSSAAADGAAVPASNAVAATGRFPAKGKPIVPPKSKSAGNSKQTSLATAANSKPSRPKATGGKVSVLPTGGTYAAPAAADEEPPTRDGAAGLGRPRPDVTPTDVIDPDAALGGCSESYGADGQCLPSIPPSQTAHAAEMVEAGLDPLSMAHPWTCPEVREYFRKGIAVRVPGVDPDGLDADQDGMACEPD